MDAVEPKGIGALQLAFEQLRDRLSHEGLFDEARKRPCRNSPNGRRGDFAHRGRDPRYRGGASPSLPGRQYSPRASSGAGEGAGERVAAAIHALNEMPQVDVLIVGRGGGASEDLWAFNEEAVVRAIVQSRVPVVSAVGHEIDVTLADFAADHRAPTPSAAAEAVVPVLAEILARFSELDGRLRRLLDNAIEIQRHRLDRSISGLGEMRFRVHAQAQHLDDLHDRMTGTVTERLTALQRDLVEHRHALLSKGPHHRIRATCLAPATVQTVGAGGASGIFRGGN